MEILKSINILLILTKNLKRKTSTNNAGNVNSQNK